MAGVLSRLKALLVDTNNNELPVQDNVTIPASTPGLIIMGSDQDGKAQRLAVSPLGNLLVTISPGDIPPARVVRQDLLNGSNENMVVNGSGTPVPFSFPADATDDIYVTKLVMMISTDSIQTNYSYFIQKPGLTNGCLLEIRSNSVTYELANFKITEDFFKLPEIPFVEAGLAKAVMVVSYPLPQLALVGGSADFVKMTIRDELDDDHIKYGFTLTVFGAKGA